MVSGAPGRAGFVTRKPILLSERENVMILYPNMEELPALGTLNTSENPVKLVIKFSDLHSSRNCAQ